MVRWEMPNNKLSAGEKEGARFAALADCCGVSAAIMTNFKLRTCCHRTGSWRDLCTVRCKEIDTSLLSITHWAQLSKCDSKELVAFLPSEGQTSTALQGPHVLWGTGEQRSGNGVVRGLHKWLAGAKLDVTKRLWHLDKQGFCEHTELLSRGKNCRVGGNGVGGQ